MSRLFKFSRWRDDADLHNQLNRFANSVLDLSKQVPALATAPATAPAPETAGGVGAASASGSSVVAGSGIATTSMGAGTTEVSNTGLLSIAGQGISISAGAATVNQQAQRVTTGAILAGATTAVTLIWTNPFADANYTPVCSVVDSTGNLTVVDIASFSATQVVVNVKNNDGSNPHTGTLCVMALHD